MSFLPGQGNLLRHAPCVSKYISHVIACQWENTTSLIFGWDLYRVRWSTIRSESYLDKLDVMNVSGCSVSHINSREYLFNFWFKEEIYIYKFIFQDFQRWSFFWLFCFLNPCNLKYIFDPSFDFRFYSFLYCSFQLFSCSSLVYLLSTFI